MKYYLVYILVFGTCDICMDLFCQWYCAKKCKYDCSKCRNWRCYKHWCYKQRGDSNETKR